MSILVCSHCGQKNRVDMTRVLQVAAGMVRCGKCKRPFPKEKAVKLMVEDMFPPLGGYGGKH